MDEFQSISYINVSLVCVCINVVFANYHHRRIFLSIFHSLWFVAIEANESFVRLRAICNCNEVAAFIFQRTHRHMHKHRHRHIESLHSYCYLYQIWICKWRTLRFKVYNHNKTILYVGFEMGWINTIWIITNT